MSWCWASLAALALGAVPAAGQQVRELGVEVVGTASAPVVGVVMATGALRTSERTRVSAAIGAGVSGGEAAWRGELLGQFLLSPRARRGVTPYAGGGLALSGGPVDRGYLVLTLGVESRPGSRSGWFVEAGAGGGARLAVGWRRRWFPPLWPLAD